MLALFMIVKNEAHILDRCLDSAQPLVDQTVIVDTGSNDDTISIAKKRGATVIEQPWKDFGHNRTQSFQAVDAKWAMTIDADMQIVCPDATKFREALDDPEKVVDGFSILQINNGTEYRNIRIMRRDRPWVCKGATHEYWACKGGVIYDLPKELIYIQDIGDGGAKADKFERDERLLREELKQEPDNERDIFYLANMLSCQERFEEAAD